MHRTRHRIAYWYHRIRAADPALDRLHGGLRAVLTAGACAAAFLLLTRWLGLPYKLALSGIVVPMIAVVVVRDPGRRAQQVTLAWVPVVASCVLVGGTLVADRPWLSGAAFVLTILAGFEAQRWGPRGGALGALAYQSFFYALLLKTPPDQVRWTPLFVFAGCAIAYVVRFGLVRERPGPMLRAELRAWRARIAVLLHDLARWLDHGSRADGRRVDAHLAALNDQSLALDARLAGAAADDASGQRAAAALRDAVLRSDLAAEAVADVARTARQDTPAAAPALATRLRAAAHDAAPPASADTALPETQHWRLDRALRTLADSAPWRLPLPAPRDAAASAPARPQAATSRTGSPTDERNARKWFDDTERRALQAGAAALGALVVGRALSASHWYWAVFAALVVFTRSATVGQTLSGAWRQVLATVAGVGFGILLGDCVHGHRTLELALLFAFVAIGFYAYKGWPNVYVVLLTAMLAMLYELMGMDSAGLLLLRLEETVAGAACAVLSAKLVLPVPTRDESDRNSAALLRSAARLLEAVPGAAPEPERADASLQPALRDAMRELDRKRQALRQSLGPVTGRANPASSDGHRQRLRQLSTVAERVRHYAALAADPATGVARDPALTEAARALGPHLDAVAAALEAPDGPAPHAPRPAAPPAADPLAPPARLASGWLAQANDVLNGVGEKST